MILNNGLKNGYNVYLKNLNTIGKNDSTYKSSPQMELMSIFEFNSSLPLVKQSANSFNYLTPKASVRFNPGDMKDNSSNDRSINVDGIFDINRLALDDSFEEGKSLTLGLEYKRQIFLILTNILKQKLQLFIEIKKDHLFQLQVV